MKAGWLHIELGLNPIQLRYLKNRNQFDKKSNFYVIFSPKIWLKLGCFTLAKLTQSGVSNVTKA